MKKMLTMLSAMALSLCTMASTTALTAVSARQRYPWNGKVDITVTFTGASNDVAKAICAFVATNGATKAAISVKTISAANGCSGAGTTWTRRFIWDAAIDVGEVKIDDVALTVNATPDGVQLWENGPYWAECNVGAAKPEEVGYYFWWGDTVGYTRRVDALGQPAWMSAKDNTTFSFHESHCTTCRMDSRDLFNAGITSNDHLAAAYDAATAHLGAPWRMPTRNECLALSNNCDMAFAPKNSVSGYRFTGRGAYASKSIFIPCSGYARDGDLVDDTSFGLYFWSSSPQTACLMYQTYFLAWHAALEQCKTLTTKDQDRYIGFPVRPLRGFATIGSTTAHLSLDCQTGVRTTGGTEHICFSPTWETDAERAVATVCVNGVIVTNVTEDGVFEWTPLRNGTYTLTHTILTNDVAVAGSLTATFVAEGFIPKTPVFYYPSGTIISGDSLSMSISCSSEDATIHYTTDGTTPTLESPVYKRFRIYGKTTVKAIAFYEDGSPSDLAVAEYARGRCEDPVITPADGTIFLHKGLEVSISKDEEGTLRYTLDGSEPTAESPVYTGPFTISESTTVKAKVFSDSFFDSPVVTAKLTRKWEQVATPVISAVTSFTGSKTQVTLSCATEGATIRYTTTGKDPNSHSTKYTGPFNVTASCMVKAYAVLTDYTNSEIASWAIEKIWGIGDSLGVPDQTFTTSGNKGWVRDMEISHDGSESMRSGGITHEEKSILSTVVQGKGTISFWWKTSCECDEEKHDWDRVEFAIDGTEIARLDGITDWIQVTNELTTEGDHTLTWTYKKDDVEFDGQDCAWVDAFAWTPVPTDPIPSIGDESTAEEIAAALSGSADTRLVTYLTTGEKYNAYRAWVNRVAGSTVAERQAVKDSPHAWLSYALDSDVLLTRVPVQGEMEIVAFEWNATTGKFNLLVAIEGFTVGTGVTAENLATLFDVMGASTIDGSYRAESVSFAFGTPSDGKVAISATPVDSSAERFFLKVKMTP